MSQAVPERALIFRGKLTRSRQGHSMRSESTIRAALGLILILAASGALAAPLALLDRNGSLVSIESYAPNVLRITLGTDKDTTLAAPGPGIIATADSRG